MTDTIADRLASTRGAGFIGRRAELDLFRSAIAAARPPFLVLHVHGPGGVGKTTLLHEFARLAREATRRVIALDGRDIPASREAFLAAIDDALASASAGERLATIPAGAVLLLDTYERLSSLDAWMRKVWLPQLPASMIVVFAGRGGPGAAWRTDLAWGPLTRTIELGNFASGESAAFLKRRGVAPAARQAVLDFTHGHPLALVLTADLLARRPEAPVFDPREAPDVVSHLLASFLEGMPVGLERDALNVCAAARVTTEPLLADLLGAGHAAAAFAWLRGQPFVETGASGVRPHDIVRELLVADAIWRDEAGWRRLSQRLYAALHARFAAARGRERERLQMDALYVTRTRPTHAGFFDWRAMENVRVEPAEPGDRGWILEGLRRHEGAASASIAERWWRVQPGAFHVLRGPDDARFGWFALLEIAGARSGAPADPAVAAARAFVDRHGGIQRGDAILYLRWWMHADLYQQVTAAINLTAMHVVAQCTTRPDVAWHFVVMADAEFWVPHFDAVNFPRVPAAEFEIGGRRYGVFAHDWRFEPPAVWVGGTRTRMPFAEPAPGAPPPEPTLREPEFRRAVRLALRDYTRSEALAANPLCLSGIVRSAPDRADGAETIRRLLREAAATLTANPRDLKLYRALQRTYFEPLATQELAAERLDLPFSTYRRHLARGIDRVAAALWRRERAQPPSA